MKESEIYIFDCPFRGEESEVLCWRAFQPEFSFLWKKYQVTYKQQKLEQKELHDRLQSIKEVLDVEVRAAI